MIRIDKKILKTLLILTLGAFLCSCVSVNLGNSQGEKASGIKYSEPADPFDDQNLPYVDEAWTNPKTGNTISFLSDCNSSTDPSLKDLRDSTLSGLKSLNLQSSEEITYNGRAGLRSLATGSLDGVDSKVDLLVFKKNNCIYFLTYTGVPLQFNVDHMEFERFVKEFNAP
ncbi:MAG: hypothetical protein KDD22_06670 [Bdellovibrionales bacterium]|nr:hypothetical protein [Bdellovibrionales bacterium]